MNWAILVCWAGCCGLAWVIALVALNVYREQTRGRMVQGVDQEKVYHRKYSWSNFLADTIAVVVFVFLGYLTIRVAEFLLQRSGQL